MTLNRVFESSFNTPFSITSSAPCSPCFYIVHSFDMVCFRQTLPFGKYTSQIDGFLLSDSGEIVGPCACRKVKRERGLG